MKAAGSRRMLGHQGSAGSTKSLWCRGALPGPSLGKLHTICPLPCSFITSKVQVLHCTTFGLRVQSTDTFIPGWHLMQAAMPPLYCTFDVPHASTLQDWLSQLTKPVDNGAMCPATAAASSKSIQARYHPMGALEGPHQILSTIVRGKFPDPLQMGCLQQSTQQCHLGSQQVPVPTLGHRLTLPNYELWSRPVHPEPR